jgi:hypothetical protein
VGGPAWIASADDPPPAEEPPVWVARIEKKLNLLLEKVEGLVSEQAELDAQVAQLVADNTALQTALATIATEVQTLINNNPGLDLSALEAAVANTGTQVTSAEQIATDATPPTT